MYIFGQAPVYIERNGSTELLGFPKIQTKEDSSIFFFEEKFGVPSIKVDSLTKNESGTIDALYNIKYQDDLISEIRKTQYYKKGFILVDTYSFIEGKPYQYNRKKAYIKSNTQFDSTSYESLSDQIIIFEDYSLRYIISRKDQSISEVLFALKSFPPPLEEFKQYGQINKSFVEQMASKSYGLYDEMEKIYFHHYKRKNKSFQLTRYIHFYANEKQRILWEDYWQNYRDSLSVDSVKWKFESAFTKLDSLKKNELFGQASKFLNDFRNENYILLYDSPLTATIDPETKGKLDSEIDYCITMKNANIFDTLKNYGSSLLLYMTYPRDPFCIDRIHSILELFEVKMQSNWLNIVFDYYLKKDYNSALLNLKNHLQNDPNDILAISLRREFQHQSNQNQELLNALEVADIYYLRNDFNMSGGIYRSILIEHPDNDLCKTRLGIIRTKID